MQTLFYIAVAYIISVLCSLIVFTIYSFDNKSNVMDKEDFYRLLMISCVPIFNILLLFGLITISFYESLLNLINKLSKK